MVTRTKIKTLTHWLFEEPVANTIPSLYALDKVMSFFIKIIYIILRILSKVTLGKKRRENSQFYRKLSSIVKVNFSFYLFMFFNRIIRLLKLGNPNLIIIYVPKYQYKVYCPATIDDFINMTIREQDIIEHFNPKK